MLKVFICKICGEPYLGYEKPENCPFCGARGNHIVLHGDYTELWKGVELTEKDRENMEYTLNLEVGAFSIYKAMSDAYEKYSRYNRMFKFLSNTEKEHASTACKFLGKEMPSQDPSKKATGSVKGDLEKTKGLEDNAIKMYKKFIGESENTNVKLFFAALIEVEKDHLDLSDDELKKE